MRSSAHLLSCALPLSAAAAESLIKLFDRVVLDLDELPASAAEILRQHWSFQDCE